MNGSEQPGGGASAELEQIQHALASVYKVERLLVRGGTGVVYQAAEVSSARPVTLTVFPSAPGLGPSAARFRAVARVVMTLNHPNVVPVYRVGFKAGVPFFVATKLVEGRTLAEIVEAQGPLPVPVTLAVLRATATAISYVHGRGTVHGALTGARIRVDRDGHVAVSEFGLARVVEDAIPEAGDTGRLASPEEAATGAAGAAGDQYALGIVALEMLTGATPPGPDLQAAARDLRSTRVALPDALVQVVQTVLARDPAERFPSATELAAAIEAIPFSDADGREAAVVLGRLARGEAVPKLRPLAPPQAAATRPAASAPPRVAPAPAPAAAAPRAPSAPPPPAPAPTAPRPVSAPPREAPAAKPEPAAPAAATVQTPAVTAAPKAPPPPPPPAKTVVEPPRPAPPAPTAAPPAPPPIVAEPAAPPMAQIVPERAAPPPAEPVRPAPPARVSRPSASAPQARPAPRASAETRRPLFSLSMPAPEEEPKRSRRGWVAVALLALAAIGGAGYWFVVRHPAATPVVQRPPASGAPSAPAAPAPQTPAAAADTTRPGRARADSGAPADNAGLITFSVEPATANIFVDGDLSGSDGALEMDVRPGRREVQITARGYETFDTMVVVRRGDTLDLGTIALVSTGAGRLELRVIPSDAQIFVDDEQVGVGSLQDVEVPAGQRRMRITSPGHVTLDTLIAVEPGKRTLLGVITLPASP